MLSINLVYMRLSKFLSLKLSTISTYISIMFRYVYNCSSFLVNYPSRLYPMTFFLMFNSMSLSWNNSFLIRMFMRWLSNLNSYSTRSLIVDTITICINSNLSSSNFLTNYNTPRVYSSNSSIRRFKPKTCLSLSTKRSRLTNTNGNVPSTNFLVSLYNLYSYSLSNFFISFLRYSHTNFSSSSFSTLYNPF